MGCIKVLWFRVALLVAYYNRHLLQLVVQPANLSPCNVKLPIVFTR